MVSLSINFKMYLFYVCLKTNMDYLLLKAYNYIIPIEKDGTKNKGMVTYLFSFTEHYSWLEIFSFFSFTIWEMMLKLSTFSEVIAMLSGSNILHVSLIPNLELWFFTCIENDLV